MEDWAEETLEKVMESKSNEYQKNKPTDIVEIRLRRDKQAELNRNGELNRLSVAWLNLAHMQRHGNLAGKQLQNA
ncbi:unnamed protein product [Ilex paraguariensis]|uniref:Uncharacterized protein n=1 Tax=Ilex paraguariensis TaxID=185542 RepID=A0ABC8QRN6_9AQUA